MRPLSQLIAGACVMLLTASASAVPIEGNISIAGSFIGNARTFGVTSKFNSFSGVEITQTGGAYDSTDAAAPVFMSGFCFTDLAEPAHWEYTFGGKTFRFDITSVEVQTHNRGFLELTGTGLAHITGLDPTPGTWSLSAAGNSPNFTARFVVPSQNVPDAGATLGLLGFALMSLGFFRKKAL